MNFRSSSFATAVHWITKRACRGKCSTVLPQSVFLRNAHWHPFLQPHTCSSDHAWVSKCSTELRARRSCFAALQPAGEFPTVHNWDTSTDKNACWKRFATQTILLKSAMTTIHFAQRDDAVKFASKLSSSRRNDCT